MKTEFDIEQWLSLITEKIIGKFKERVIYIGHVGSYARGEATNSSDIDINVILDKVDFKDIDEYKSIVISMPFHEKACGFLADRAELMRWPRHELFHFLYGSRTLYGQVLDFIAEPTKDEIKFYLKISVSGILHFARHTYIYSHDLANDILMMKDCFKSSFFILQAYIKLHEDKIILKKSEVIKHELDDLSKAVLIISQEWPHLEEDLRKRPEYYFKILIDWSSFMMKSIEP